MKVSAKRLSQLASDREAQAGPMKPVALSGANLSERLQHLRDILRRDTRAVILDLKRKHTVRAGKGAALDAPTIGCEFDGIAQKITLCKRIVLRH